MKEEMSEKTSFKFDISNFYSFCSQKTLNEKIKYVVKYVHFTYRLVFSPHIKKSYNNILGINVYINI